jgi:hypothetical protein
VPIFDRMIEALRNPSVRRFLVRALILAIGVVTIARWQYRFLTPGAAVPAGHTVTASTGINRDRQFFFFLYHLNKYPIASDATKKADTREEAERLLHDEPTYLKQDEGSTFRSGDRGRTYLYFVDAWLRKRALDASLKPTHALAFGASLIALFISFWWIGRTAQGALLVVLLGSNPFQLNAVFAQENVFSWPITSMIAALALQAPLLQKPDTPGKGAARWYPWVAAIGTGVLIGVVRNFRSEPTVVLLSAVLVYATMTWISRWRRGALVLLMVVSMTVTGTTIRGALERKFHDAQATVAAVGGSPYDGPREYFHEFWHVIFCGLGDFGTDKGYYWEDTVAYRVVFPKLQAMHPDEVLFPERTMHRTYDKAGKYPIFIFEVPGYHDLVRDKVVGDIKADPKWYLRILWKRLDRVFDRTTPVGVAFSDASYYMSSQMLGWLWLPILALTALARRWFYAKLLLFSVPLSIAPLFIYSDGGMTCYTTFHAFGVFVMIVLAWTGAARWWQRRHALRYAA